MEFQVRVFLAGIATTVVEDQSSAQSKMRSILRIVARFTFSLWGYMRLFGAFGRPKAVNTLLIVAGILELFGRNLILLGLFTRCAAAKSTKVLTAVHF